MVFRAGLVALPISFALGLASEPGRAGFICEEHGGGDGGASVGQYGFACGARADASGSSTTASDVVNTAIGTDSNASGDGSINTASGTWAEAYGHASRNVATGAFARAYGDDSRHVAVGDSADAHGNHGGNIAIGALTRAEGSHSGNVAFGAQSWAAGEYSFREKVFPEISTRRIPVRVLHVFLIHCS
jgi:trimeric autotransporter adhesin